MTTQFTLSIATGDKILRSIKVGDTDGYEVVTNVSSATDSDTGETVYTITTATDTIEITAATTIEESVNSAGVKVWVIGQNR
jgi:hypothetical protein